VTYGVSTSVKESVSWVVINPTGSKELPGGTLPPEKVTNPGYPVETVVVVSSPLPSNQSFEKVAPALLYK
jgi:hypothetical protein